VVRDEWLSLRTSFGQLEAVKVMIDRKVPMEIVNKYGGKVLGQALWSAIRKCSVSASSCEERFTPTQTLPRALPLQPFLKMSIIRSRDIGGSREIT